MKSGIFSIKSGRKTNKGGGVAKRIEIQYSLLKSQKSLGTEYQ